MIFCEVNPQGQAPFIFLFFLAFVWTDFSGCFLAGFGEAEGRLLGESGRAEPPQLRLIIRLLVSPGHYRPWLFASQTLTGHDRFFFLRPPLWLGWKAQDGNRLAEL